MRWPWSRPECQHKNIERWETGPVWLAPWGSICTKCADCGLFLSQTMLPHVPPRMQYVERYRELKAAYKEARR